MTPPSSWWEPGQGQITQGELLEGCKVPQIPIDYGDSDTAEIPFRTARVIVVTQSCDLENPEKNLRSITVCPVYTQDEWGQAGNPIKPEKLDAIGKNRVILLHSLDRLPDGTGPFIVDFRDAVNLPVSYVQKVMQRQKSRIRLVPPHIENLGSRFGNIYSRVAIPRPVDFK